MRDKSFTNCFKYSSMIEKEMDSKECKMQAVCNCPPWNNEINCLKFQVCKAGRQTQKIRDVLKY